MDTKKLTPLHWRVYDTIKASTEYGYAITQRDLCEAVGLPYSPKPTNCRAEEKGDHCRELWTIITDLNNSLEIDKMIYCHHYTYRIATEEEAEKMAKAQFDKFITAKARYAVLLHKCHRDGQGKLLSNQGVEITDDSKAERFHDSFFREVKEEKATADIAKMVE